METVQLFGYAVPIATLHPRAAAGELDFDELFVALSKAESIVDKAGLEDKVHLHPYSENRIRYIFFALAGRQPYLFLPDRVPIGTEPHPEAYKTLRRLLRIEGLGGWRQIRMRAMT